MIKFHLKASHNIRWSATGDTKGTMQKKTILKEKRMHSLAKRQKTQIPQIITQKTGAT